MKIPSKVVTVVEHYAIAYVSTIGGIWYSGDHHPLGVAKAAAAAVFGPVIGGIIAKAKKMTFVYKVGKTTIKSASTSPTPSTAVVTTMLV